MGLPGQDYYRDVVERLAAIERPSASVGERVAAELVAAELEREGGVPARLEEEDAHGTYWWPIGLMTGLAAVAPGRVLGALVGLAAAAGVADDVRHSKRWFRRLLPTRTTTNVVAEMGPKDAGRTFLFIAHHDAAHSGAVFEPTVQRKLAAALGPLWDRVMTTPPTMWSGFIGPLFVGLGALLDMPRLRGAGRVLAAGTAAGMADIGMRAVVPGANDNASAVAVILGLARSFREDPLPDTRVILLSTGAEESFSEGMQGFANRHFASFDQDATYAFCIDTVGSPQLLSLEGEGMLGIWEYPKDFVALVHRTAEELGIEIFKGLRFRNATDGVFPLKAGFKTMMIGSADEYRIPSNYHWPTDTAENVDYGTVEEAARLCEALARRMAGSQPANALEPPVQE